MRLSLQMYQGKEVYLQLMHDFIAFKISGEVFVSKFNSQRSIDLGKERIYVDDPYLENDKLTNDWYAGIIQDKEYIKKAFLLPHYPLFSFFQLILDSIHSQDNEDFLPDDEHEEAANDPDPPLFPWITEAQLRERVKQKLEWIEAFEAHVIKRDGALPSICGPNAPVLTDFQTPKNSSEIQ
jgi:hypothetical protein